MNGSERSIDEYCQLWRHGDSGPTGMCMMETNRMNERNNILNHLRNAARGGSFVALSLAAMLAPSLWSQVSSYGDKEMGSSNDIPAILNKVGIAQNLNQQLPLDLAFIDDEGKPVQLSSYFGRKPAIMALVYFQCTVLCSEELHGLASALRVVDEVPGRDFNIIAVSIDPDEGPKLAADEKIEHLKEYGHLETSDGWHFLTGTQPSIDALTRAVGFRYVKIPLANGKTQFAHSSSIQIVTPQGKLAQYYMGVEYSPKDLRLGLAEASSNRIGSPVDNILTYCYHYDPLTNKYSLIVARVVQAGGVVTLLLLGGFIFIMFRRDARQNKPNDVRAPEQKQK
jgi:protein SCO1